VCAIQIGACLLANLAARAQKRQFSRLATTRRDAIVTSMVRLKYGANSLISHRLIAEASISLSTWMASSKASLPAHKIIKTREGVSHKVRSGASASEASQGVNQFAAAYLGGGAAGRDGNAGQLAKESKLPLTLPDLCRALLSTYRNTRANSPPRSSQPPDRKGKARPETVGVAIPDPNAPPASPEGGGSKASQKARESQSPTKPWRHITEATIDPDVDNVGSRLGKVVQQQSQARNNWTPQRSMSVQAHYHDCEVAAGPLSALLAGRWPGMAPEAKVRSASQLTMLAHLPQHHAASFLAHTHPAHASHLAQSIAHTHLPALQPSQTLTRAMPVSPNQGMSLPSLARAESRKADRSCRSMLARAASSSSSRRSPQTYRRRSYSQAVHHERSHSPFNQLLQHAKAGSCVCFRGSEVHDERCMAAMPAWL
jgi:hypothetical protein